MKCNEVIELMQRDLDSDLNNIEQQKLAEHMANCTDCAAMYKKLKNLSGQLENLPDVKPAYSLVDAIKPELEKIDKKENEKQVRNKFFAHWKLYGSVTAAGILIAITLVNNPWGQEKFGDMSAENQSSASMESASDSNLTSHDGPLQDSAAIRDSNEENSGEAGMAPPRKEAMDATEQEESVQFMAVPETDSVIDSAKASPSGDYIAEVEKSGERTRIIINSRDGAHFFISHEWSTDSTLDYNWETDQLLVYQLELDEKTEKWEIHLPGNQPPYEKEVLVTSE